MTPEEILRYRSGCRLRGALEAVGLPKHAMQMLCDQTGTYLGPTLSEVILFALQDWLHHNAEKLPRVRREGCLIDA